MLSIKAISASILLVFCMTVIAQPSKWVICASTEKVYYYVDKSTRKKVNGNYRAWVRIETRQYWEKVVARSRFELYSEFKGVDIAAAEVKYKDFSHTLVLTEYDCRQDRFRDLTFLDYSKDGSVIESHDYDTTSWAFVVPGTIGSGIMQCICSSK